MKKRCMEGAMACLGAVVGAGFVSGREVCSFFTRYGAHSWWLIAVAAVVAILLTALCMRRASSVGNWCALFDGKAAGLPGEICVIMLLCIIGGAMVSASGHMIALLWPWEWAYSIGAVGSLCLAWIIGTGSMKPLSLGGGALALLAMGSMLALIRNDGIRQSAALAAQPGAGELIWAGVCAAAYAAMNITIAIGVICKTCGSCCRKNDRQSVAFGLLLALLLFISNYLYLKHPELLLEPFPIVRLFAAYGRNGFVASVVLLYLAVFTTLVAIVFALRGAMEARVRSRTFSALLAMGLPVLVSLIGFAEIVDGLYAPIGLICLAAVFAPLLRKGTPKTRA